MGTLTKIAIVVLVVLILLACPVFITQATLTPGYLVAYKSKMEEIGILQQEVRHSKLVLQQMTAERDRLSTALTKDTGALQGEIDRLRTELVTERQRSAKLESDLQLINGEISKLRLDYESNTKRTAALAEQRDDAFSKVQALNDELRKITDQLKQTQLDMDRQGGMIRALREQLVERDERIRQYQQQLGPAALTATAPATGPPAVGPDMRISGTLTAVKGDLVSINIGSAKGVRQGMLLIVYRGADYVAKFRVDQVDVAESAGIILDKRLDPMPGDKVADRLE